MDLLEGLTQLGLNEYEARAYAALLAHPGSTGYEVAGHSGVPRGRIYDVLGGLAAKGAAHTSREGDRTLYHPVDHGTLLRRHRERAEQLAAMLGPALAELAGSQADAPFLTIRGSGALLSRAQEIAAGARLRLFVSGWPADLERLAPALRAAEERGVRVFALVYGDARLGLSRQFHHDPPEAANRLGNVLPALAVAADQTEALLAHMAPDRQATGMWTRNPAVVLVAAEYIRHDIFVAETYRRLPEPVQRQLARTTRDLQEMWFLTPEEIAPCKL